MARRQADDVPFDNGLRPGNLDAFMDALNDAGLTTKSDNEEQEDAETNIDDIQETNIDDIQDEERQKDSDEESINLEEGKGLLADERPPSIDRLAPLAPGEEYASDASSFTVNVIKERNPNRLSNGDKVNADEIEMASLMAPSDVSSEAPGAVAEPAAVEIEMGEVAMEWPHSTASEEAPKEQDPGWVEYGDYGDNARDNSVNSDVEWVCPVRVPVVSEVTEAVVNRLGRLSTKHRLLVGLAALLLVGVLLLVTLLPASFVYVEYYEYGLNRNKWTGAVDYSRVYDFGCYLQAPQDEMIRLPATAQLLERSYELMTGQSLAVTVDFYLQYSLRRNEVVDLFKKYHTEFNGVISSIVESTVKNYAIRFNLDDFRLNRKNVEANMTARVKEALKDYHVDLKFLQLGKVTIPDTVTQLYLSQMLNTVLEETEYFNQDRALEVKETERRVKRLRNKAHEVIEKANAEAKLINAQSEANYFKITQTAYQEALKNVFSRLNVTKEENKLSFMYVKALENSKQTYYSFNSGENIAFTP